MWIVMGEGSPAGSCEPGGGGNIGPGRFGYAYINSIIGNDLILDRPIPFSGATNPSANLSAWQPSYSPSLTWCHMQVVRVPNFQNLNVLSSGN